MKTEVVRNALNELDTWLRKTELAALRAWGLSLDYVVISPISPVNRPQP